MRFELRPVKKIPDGIRKRHTKRQLKINELEISYMKRVTGRDITPSLRR